MPKLLLSHSPFLRWAVALVVVLSGCASTRNARNEAPRLSMEQITRLVPERVKDREGWARDVFDALDSLQKPTHAENVCSVLAVIEQESGFNENPSVPNLSKIVRAKLEEHAAKLGPFGSPIVKEFLSGRAPGQTLTFEKRLERVKTEQDLDRVFRDLLRYQESEHPKTFKAVDLASSLFGKGRLRELNPITTAGAMQVSVRFAQEQAEEEGRKLSDEELRDELYTRVGGVHFGTARLLTHDAAYPSPIFRFADYNAGVYASRNAALQQVLAELTGRKLALDGDFLAYDAEGEPKGGTTRTVEALLDFRERFAPDLSTWRVERDVRREKEKDFEETATVEALLRVYKERFGKTPPYAVVPDVTLNSPKMRTGRTTAWFAKSVQTRFDRCFDLARGAGEVAMPSRRKLDPAMPRVRLVSLAR